jgi:hypothetical protein
LILSVVICCAIAQLDDSYAIEDDMEAEASEMDLAVAESKGGKGAAAGAAAAAGAKAAAGAAAAGAAGAKGMTESIET